MSEHLLPGLGPLGARPHCLLHIWELSGYLQGSANLTQPKGEAQNVLPFQGQGWV